MQRKILCDAVKILHAAKTRHSQINKLKKKEFKNEPNSKMQYK